MNFFDDENLNNNHGEPYKKPMPQYYACAAQVPNGGGNGTSINAIPSSRGILGAREMPSNATKAMPHY